MLRSEKVQECVRKYTEEMLYDGRIDAEGIDASTAGRRGENHLRLSWRHDYAYV